MCHISPHPQKNQSGIKVRSKWIQSEFEVEPKWIVSDLEVMWEWSLNGRGGGKWWLISNDEMSALACTEWALLMHWDSAIQQLPRQFAVAEPAKCQFSLAVCCWSLRMHLRHWYSRIWGHQELPPPPPPSTPTHSGNRSDIEVKSKWHRSEKTEIG